MVSLPLEDEAGRLDALAQMEILDTPAEPAFDDFVRLAAHVCATPMALVSLIDSDRQWFKARVGVDLLETPREVSFCTHAIRGADLFVIPDAAVDPRFSRHPVVLDEPRLRFYAGMPLLTPEGFALGTLCVLDLVPRCLSGGQAEGLRALGRRVADELSRRLDGRRLGRAIEAGRLAEEALQARDREVSEVIERAAIGLRWVAPGGRIEWANQAELEMLGYAREEYIGKPVEMIHADPELVARMHRRLWAGESLHDVEARLVCRDGSIREVLINAHVLRDPEGRPVQVRSSTRDLTERRRAEAEALRVRRDLEGRLAEQALELRRLREELEAGGDCRLKSEREARVLNRTLERRLRRVDALRQVDLAICVGQDLQLTLGVVLDQALAHLGVHAAAILSCDPLSLTLRFAAGRGYRGFAIASTSLRIGQGLAGRAAMERRVVHVADLGEAREVYPRVELLAEEEFVSYLAAPLIAKGRVVGVLEVCQREPLEVDPEWLAFFEALAGQAAIAMDNATLFEDLRRAHLELGLSYDATIEGWARALDLRDKETEGHTRRVTELTVQLARASGVGEEELRHIRRGAMLHDIGKMGIPDAILLKPGPLTDEEWRIMRRHPDYAREWLAPIPYLRPALEIPFGHHERWDGVGYPRGLKGEEIPFAARLFAAVDIYDALRSDRPYRAGWPEDRVREHIRGLAGTHLDPGVVATFLALTEPDRGRITHLR